MARNIGIVGAGLMGGEIALVFALAGHSVQLKDRDRPTLERCVARLRALMEKGVSRGFYTQGQIDPTLARIQLTLDFDRFADCELVVEAVFESLELKTQLLAQLDQVCDAGCIIASNTSTIPISTLAAAVASGRRSQIIGTHYFSPVTRMALVEVIAGFDTADVTTQSVLTIMREIGKTPICVKDVAGFAVNRMLHMFIIEAIKLVEEGVATPEDLDTACRLGLGHPIGPFALMDAVTSSLCLDAQEIMHEAYGERFRPPALLKQRVGAGYSGGKGRQGWYPPKKD